MPNLVRFKSMGLKGKIILLPLLGILALVLVSGVDWYLRVEKNKQSAIGKASDTISMSVLDLLHLEEKYLKEQGHALLSRIEENTKKLQQEVEKLAKTSKNKEVLAKLDKFGKALKDHQEHFKEMVEHGGLSNKARIELAATFKKANQSLEEIIQGINQKEANMTMEGDLLDSVSSSARNQVKDLSAFGNKYMLAVYELITFENEAQYKKTIAALSKSMALGVKNTDIIFSSMDSNEFVSKWRQAKAELSKLAPAEKAFFTNWKEVKINLPELRASAKQMQSLLKEISDVAQADMKKGDRIGAWVAVLSSVITIVALMLFGFAISRSVGRSVGSIAETLRDGSEQVASASQQVSSASQSLAEGASEQASAVEETSSSLEEMSSMTKQNAQNAAQADSLMKETTAVVTEANKAMSEMIKSMEEVSSASHETQKIIKDIDEVAFQTNLLALNAAVEAARAGEAGAGFAVVADEVRSLAMRAADAAKNTAALIEKTINKVNVGTELVNKTNESFGQVEEKANKVAMIVAEIAEASNEQAEGIEQINRAIIEMDKVIQQNAANAEESASASEELSAQAEHMKGLVQELVRIVEGAKAGINVDHKKRGNIHEPSHKVQSRRPRKEAASRKTDALGTSTSPAPDKVIPFDEDEGFEEF